MPGIFSDDLRAVRWFEISAPLRRLFARISEAILLAQTRTNYFRDESRTTLLADSGHSREKRTADEWTYLKNIFSS